VGTAPNVAVIGDITGNIFPVGTPLSHADAILGTRQEETLRRLAPDLLITLGGALVSKYLKLFLRRYPPQQHWHVDPSGEAADTYQALTHILPVQPASFLQQLASTDRAAAAQPDLDYRAHWLALETSARTALREFLEDAPFGEFQAVYRILQALPPHTHLQVGNSMAIRYVSFIGDTLAPLASAESESGPSAVHSNRGVSGIDGTVSTAVGAALATDAMTTLITGDLGFFYDRNGLWHAHVPPNLRIVVLNNHGGGIFNLIEGPNQLAAPVRETFFLTPQPLTAQRTAADHGLDYVGCANATDLAQALESFWTPRARAAILEVETDMALNTQVFQEFKQRLARAW
jgi:2-succinyl-5-enolpyruvyl-6-hydroxy-3-cyclohexene-1-carboxylate synthase